MKLILKGKVADLGNIGDVVTVSDGYARNFLIPRDLAIRADKASVKRLEHERRMIQAREEKILKETHELAERLEDFSCTISAKAGDEDKLFGSVSAADIAEALQQAALPIDKNSVDLEEPIKELGVYSVRVNLARGVTARLKVWVVRE